MEYDFKNTTFEDTFNYGLELAKKKSKDCEEFFKMYIKYLFENNPKISSIEEATKCAKDNFGYFAGYYGDDVRKLIAKTYNALHPYFGDKYNISAEEAFKTGLDRANGVKYSYNS